MKGFIVVLLFLATVALTGCGSSGSMDDNSTVKEANQPITYTLHKGKSDILKKGDKIKALTDNTKLNIITDVDTFESNVTVLEGEAEVTKY